MKTRFYIFLDSLQKFLTSEILTAKRTVYTATVAEKLLFNNTLVAVLELPNT